jgi:hypothetical protein
MKKEATLIEALEAEIARVTNIKEGLKNNPNRSYVIGRLIVNANSAIDNVDIIGIVVALENLKEVKP